MRIRKKTDCLQICHHPGKSLLILSTVLLWTFVHFISAEPADSRPNIIFFLSDDHRDDFMGCAGHSILKTPIMDRLAREGIRFRNMFVTTSICAASRASIFTGLYERTHRYTFKTPPIQDKHLVISYPAMLKKAGYWTGFVGKFGVGVSAEGRAKMFDSLVPLGRNPYFKKQKGGDVRHLSEISGDRAIEFLRTAKKGKPFCLSVSFNAPHAEDRDRKNHYPWPKAVDGLYNNITVPAPRLSQPAVFESQPEFLKKSLNRQRWYWRWDTPEKYQRNIKAYYRMISGIDNVMGRVLDALKELELDSNTIVIFAGDNGYYKGARGFAGKWSHYEESLRVPLIIFDPRAAQNLRGTIKDLMALNIDIAATILSYAGVEIPEQYQGSSLLPFMKGKSPEDWRDDFFCEHLMDHASIPKYEGVRGQRYVYARYFQQQPVYEFLHDLQRDPDQLQNFASDAAHTETLERMRKRCDELMNAYGGRFVPHKRVKQQRKTGKKDMMVKLLEIEGVSGKALYFNGRALRLGTLPHFKKTESFTWSFWAKLDKDNARSAVILGNRRNGNEDGADKLQFIKFTPQGVRFFNSNTQRVFINHMVPTDRWSHFALVKKGSQLGYFVEGKSVGKATADFDTPELPLFVGGDPVAHEMANVAVDEIKLFKSALTEVDIQRLSKREDVDDELWKSWDFDD